MSKLSIILSIALALSAVFSPVFVAIINNRNTTKLRIAEFNHLEEIKKMELLQHLEETRFQKEYDSKKTAFSELIKSAARYHSDPSNHEALEALYSSAHYSMSVCSTNTCRHAISEFIKHLVLYPCKENVEESFLFDLSMLSSNLSKELFIKDNPIDFPKEK